MVRGRIVWSNVWVFAWIVAQRHWQLITFTFITPWVALSQAFFIRTCVQLVNEQVMVARTTSKSLTWNTWKKQRAFRYIFGELIRMDSSIVGHCHHYSRELGHQHHRHFFQCKISRGYLSRSPPQNHGQVTEEAHLGYLYESAENFARKTDIKGEWAFSILKTSIYEHWGWNLIVLKQSIEFWNMKFPHVLPTSLKGHLIVCIAM